MTKTEQEHILEELDRRDIEHDVYSHGRIHSSEEAADERDHDLDETVKSLVLEAGDDVVLYALPGNRLVDFEALADELGVDDVSLSDPTTVEEVTGCVVGSVPPFGPCLGLESYVDEAVLEKDVVHASIATHTDSVAVTTDVFDELDFDVLSCSYEKEM